MHLSYYFFFNFTALRFFFYFDAMKVHKRWSFVNLSQLSLLIVQNEILLTKSGALIDCLIILEVTVNLNEN